MGASYIEILLLFAIFYLPSYVFFPAGYFGARVFDNPIFHLQYWISAIPQILLVLYLMEKEEGFVKYGVRRVGFAEVKAALASTVFLIAIGLFSSILAKSLQIPVIAAGPAFTKFSMLPLVVITCFVTGYREETFFRSFMITKMEGENSPTWAIYGGTSVLFGLGHSYQGLFGILATGCIGLCLAAIFRKTKNLHVNAISHAVYNLIILLIGFYLVE